MEWVEWEPTYNDIVQRLKLNPTMDREATRVLSDLLSDYDPYPLMQSLSNLIKDQEVLISGPAPSLEKHLQQIIKEGIDKYTIVAVDGASTALIENRIHCDVIITDLDGNLNDIKTHHKNGAIVVIHAHGDNIETVQKHVPEILPALGSTQVEPTNRAFLWGGFTDGDRATHIVSEYSPKRVVLAGMDFGPLVGWWSKPGHTEHYLADARKKIKLSIAKELIFSPLKRSNIPYWLME